MRYLMIAAMLLLLTCTEAVAKSVIVYGYGSSSCGAWLEAREGPNALTSQRSVWMVHWVSGFLSAYNAYGGSDDEVLRGTDMYGATAWIDKYCRDNPTATVLTAVIALTVHLDAR